jgi:hypothetical protein
MTTTTEARAVRLVGHSDLNGWGDAFQVTVRDGIAYVAASGDSGHEGTTILDVRDPSQPRVIAQMPAPEGTHSHKTQLLDHYLIVNHEQRRDYTGNAFRPGIRIVDISDPANPRDAVFFPTAGRGVHRPIVDPSRRRAYLSTRDDEAQGQLLWIVDLADPLHPSLLGRWWHPGQQLGAPPEAGNGLGRTLHEARPHGDRLYLCYLDGGLAVLDISDPSQPRLTGTHTVSDAFAPHHHTPWPLPNRNLLLVTHETVRPQCAEPPAFLWIYDISDPDRPTPISTYMPVSIDPITKQPTSGDFCARGGRYGAHNLWAGDGNLVYVAWFNAGLRIVDIADPHHPVEAGYYIPPAPAGRPAAQSNDVFVDDRGVIYLTDRWGVGLDILEFEGSR